MKTISSVKPLKKNITLIFNKFDEKFPLYFKYELLLHLKYTKFFVSFNQF